MEKKGKSHITSMKIKKIKKCWMKEERCVYIQSKIIFQNIGVGKKGHRKRITKKKTYKKIGEINGKVEGDSKKILGNCNFFVYII